MDIRPVAAILFRANRWTDGQTDMTKRIVAFYIVRTRLKMILPTRYAGNLCSYTKPQFSLALPLVR
jgi:hypothetical protein